MASLRQHFFKIFVLCLLTAMGSRPPNPPRDTVTVYPPVNVPPPPNMINPETEGTGVAVPGLERVRLAPAGSGEVNKKTISAHDVCKIVENVHEKEVFVPIKTAKEWESFIKHPPSTVIISSCPPLRYEYNIPGSYTWSKPAGAVNIIMQCWGGGGAGGDGKGTGFSGGGGGGGGYSMQTVLSASVPTSLTVVVGAGGINYGSNGQASYVGSFANAGGGANGLDGSNGGVGGAGGVGLTNNGQIGYNSFQGPVNPNNCPQNPVNAGGGAGGTAGGPDGGVGGAGGCHGKPGIGGEGGFALPGTFPGGGGGGTGGGGNGGAFGNGGAPASPGAGGRCIIEVQR